MIEFVLDKEENTVGKKENIIYHHFLLLFIGIGMGC